MLKKNSIAYTTDINNSVLKIIVALEQRTFAHRYHTFATDCLVAIGHVFFHVFSRYKTNHNKYIIAVYTL